MAKLSPASAPALTRAQLVHIVESSAFLQERLDGEFVPAPSEPDGDILSRIELWKRAAAGGDTERFRRRLSWGGADPDNPGALLGAVQLPPGRDLPGWTVILEEYFEALAAPRDRQAPQWVNLEAPLPFEELFAALVDLASERVRRETGAVKRVCEPAFTNLQRALLERLTAIAGDCLDVEFTAFRSVRQVSTGVFGFWPGVPSRHNYDAFIAHMLRGAMAGFLCKYPVLARYLATTADLWVEATIEFLNRLEQDLPALGNRFLNGAFPGGVVDVRPSLSDRHNGGRSAVSVRFSSGLQVIYKPKHLCNEQLFYDLVSYLNEAGSGLRLQVFRVLDCGTHGWSETIEHLPCNTAEEVSRYFERAGSLLCLMFVLEAMDCQYENIIASGEYPALVDMETLLQHRVAEYGTEKGPWSAANRAFFLDSVFRTGLLPRWQFGVDGESFDLSGLGAIESQRTSLLIND